MNITQTLLTVLNHGELSESFSRLLDQPVSATRHGVTAAVPVIIAGAMARASTEEGARSLIELIHGYKIDGGILNRLGFVFDHGSVQDKIAFGGGMLQSIFGDRLAQVANVVASSSGLTSEATHSLMALVTPSVLGGIASAAPAGELTAAGVADVLAGEQAHVGALGAEVSSLMASAPPMVVLPPPAKPAPASEGARPIWPLVLLAVLVGLLLLLGLRMCSTGTTTKPIAETPAVPAPVEQPVAEPVATAELALPTGEVLSVPPGSVGENLYNFLTGAETGSKMFLFDGLTFDSGSATLSADSQTTVVAIAEILNAFGAVTISVDGYTDNTGAPAVNLQLSEARANAVRDALVAAGVDASRIAAAGHGEDKPVADNGTEDGRAQNRRTELTATKN